MARAVIHDEVKEDADGEAGWTLCFQRCTWHHEGDDPSETGYRFIWRDANGGLQSDRSQTRIPDMATLQRLTEAANSAGWFR